MPTIGSLIYDTDDTGEAWPAVITGLTVQEEPVPEVPPPVWDARPIDGERAMAAVRAMCG